MYESLSKQDYNFDIIFVIIDQSYFYENDFLKDSCERR